MGGKCNCCGYDRCLNALAFHHLDPSKKDLGFGATRANPINWPKIVEELRKCILVCHNCHSEIHAGEREWPEIRQYFDEAYSDYKEILRLSKRDPCPICGELKPLHNITCSSACAATKSRKIDWDALDLEELVKTMPITAISALIGVSDSSVGKRLRKLGIDYPTKQRKST